MDRKELPEELKAKARTCESPEELIELAKDEGIELSDEQLSAVSGGWGVEQCDEYECQAYT